MPVVVYQWCRIVSVINNLVVGCGRYAEPDEMLCQRVMLVDSRDWSQELAAAHKVQAVYYTPCLKKTVPTYFLLLVCQI